MAIRSCARLRALVRLEGKGAEKELPLIEMNSLKNEVRLLLDRYFGAAILLFKNMFDNSGLDLGPHENSFDPSI